MATILVAEDPFVSNFLRTILERHGHNVVIAEANHGNELMRTGGVKASMVITNTPRAFLPFAVDIPMLYLAASPDPALALCFHTCRVLRKPFRNEDLLKAVEELSPPVVI